MLSRRLMLCAAAGAAILGISSLAVHAEGQHAAGPAAAAGAPASPAGATPAHAAAGAVQRPAMTVSRSAITAAQPDSAALSASPAVVAPGAQSSPPQDITVHDSLGIACINVGTRGCEANNVAVSTGGPVKACGNPHAAISPDGYVEPCP